MKKTAERRETNWKNAEIPITIGISAHRNIQPDRIKEVKDQITATLTEIKNLCPQTPIIMINGLAEGGDQLCADVAVELGIDIVIALPFAEEKYINDDDFSKEAQRHYCEIKNSGRVIKTLVVPDIEKLNDGSKDYLFRQQSIYVATNCHLLLALWDGTRAKHQRTECGTNAAIDFALRHNYHQPTGNEFYASYDGAVAAIFAPRIGKTYSQTAVSCKYLLNDSDCFSDNYIVKNNLTDAVQLRRTLGRTNDYNIEYIKYKDRVLKGKDEKWTNYLIGKEEYDCGDGKTRKIHDCQQVADNISAYYKTKFLRGVKLLAAFGVMLILSFMLYDQLSFLWTSVLCFATLILLGLCYVTVTVDFKGGDDNDAHAKFVEYRVLAETLRVQYYLTAYNLDDNACSFFAWSHKNNIIWIKKAITALLIGENEKLWEKPSLQDFYKTTDDISLINYDDNESNKYKIIFENRLFKQWAGKDRNLADKNHNGQLGYHLCSAKEKRAAIKKRNAVNKVALIATLIFYLVLFALEISQRVDMTKPLFWVVDTQMLMKGLLSVSASITFYLTYKNGKESLDQACSDSANMVRLYQVALAQVVETQMADIPDSEKHDELESLIRELAREQLIENSSWLAYNRDNNIDLPI